MARSGGEQYKVIARRYGVSPRQIQRICYRKAWKWVD